MQHDSLSRGQDALSLKSRGGVVRVFKAAGYSLAGLRAAFTHEAAFRQLLLLAAALIPLAFWLPVSRVERAMLVGVVLLALIVAILHTPETNNAYPTRPKHLSCLYWVIKYRT